ncbi:Tmem25 [Columba guinea]|nr:Tmem25 [Columba guinea]
MGCPGGCPGAALARQLLLLSLPVLCSAGEAAVGSGTQLWQQHPLQHRPAVGSPAGLGEPGPTIDGQALALCTLREGESRSFTCRTPRPAPGAALLWYLDGQRQEANCSATDATSTITLTARRSDRQLSCSLMDVASGEKRDASVLLDVQCKVCGTGQRRGEGAWGSEQDFDPCPSQPEQDGISPVLCRHAYKPEILQANARYQEAEGTGLLLLLFVLVRANPPASITWVAPDGQVMANTSEFLLLGATHHQGLANHSLRVHLSSVAANFSVSAANSVGVTTTSVTTAGVTTAGVTTASLLPTGLLDARVELPLLGVAVGAALALSALVTLGSCAAGLACRRAKPVAASPGDAGASIGEERSARLGLQDSLVLGFVQLPTSGRIYKVPSVSSDEIWL